MVTPEFINNLDGNTLAAAVARILADGVPRPDGTFGKSPRPAPAQLDIATAFFNPAGFAAISSALGAVEHIRLMVGAEPPAEARHPTRALDETPELFRRRLLASGLADFDDGLRQARDRFPFTRTGRASLRTLIAVLQSGRMETRRYERAFMHAKAYIFAPRPEHPSGGQGVIAGSSNLTRAGVLHNLELNLGRFDDPVVGQARAWFDRLWDEAVPCDLTTVLEEVFAAFTPFEIFLRVLFQLYGGEVTDDEAVDEGLPLTSFQKHGAARAMRLIRTTGGAIVADEVGLGKTFIAGEILKFYLGNRHRCLLVCPAQLRDTMWRKFRSDWRLEGAECLSYEQLARDRQIGELMGASGQADQDELARPLDEYQLVVIDEAHNYRNPDTPTRAAVLRALLKGENRRDVLMLTATPVNNSLWDLYQLIRYYQPQDAFLADRGILSVRERFEAAARIDPSDLSPDQLYPIIDATTVKRTRQFVKKHYSGDTIALPDGTKVQITFPDPKAISVRYPLSDPLPDLFDKIERALDPDDGHGGEGVLTFARYHPGRYLRSGAGGEEWSEENARAAATIGLLRSGLLKRFESSAFAFARTVGRMIDQHRIFLAALDDGFVVTTRFLKELSAEEGEDLASALAGDEDKLPASQFHETALRAAVEADLEIFTALANGVAAITPERDPKLAALTGALEAIAAQAAEEAVSEDDARQKRKVIVFSFFADTVEYLRRELGRLVDVNADLLPWRGRIAAVAGSGEVETADVSRAAAVAGFAPVSMEALDRADRFDLLMATDILAEGVNLQQARNIINYDVPWNPMRLVQRHGRIDRIGSRHNRVFLRTIFPAERLDQLLNLEQRILMKIALAAASVGVVAPVERGVSGAQVFSETREEIEKLLAEDNALYEHGGGAGAAQTGEEYRQTLRQAMSGEPGRIERMPLGAGSGMAKGETQGVFFSAAIGERTYLRFAPTDAEWRSIDAPMIGELGACLRLIECEPATPRHFPPALDDAVFDLWDRARDDIHAAWMVETDPANLQPKVRPLNGRVADFIRANLAPDQDGAAVREALDILEAPWPRRDELLLRDWFAEDDLTSPAKAQMLIRRIRASGLAPFRQPPLLPPIEKDDVTLVCWMGISPVQSMG